MLLLNVTLELWKDLQNLIIIVGYYGKSKCTGNAERVTSDK